MTDKKSIKHQSEVLDQITKVSDAIRRKYKIIKVGRESSEQVANDVFKPIVTPLQALVKNSKVVKYEIKPENSLNYSLKNVGKSDFETIQNKSEDDSYYDLNNASNSMVMNQTVISPEFTSTPQKDQNHISEYISRLDRKNSKGMDTRFGIRKKNHQLFLGDSLVQFQDNNIIIKNKTIPLTPGLIELIFRSDPRGHLLSDDDVKKYQDLIVLTNTHRKHYDPDQSLYSDKSLKYNKYIAEIFKVSKEGRGLPTFMSASRKRKNIDYVYWDDPNELVDRLRLLTASQAAGNSNHSNEIISIIEELREAEIIY